MERGEEIPCEQDGDDCEGRKRVNGHFLLLLDCEIQVGGWCCRENCRKEVDH